MNRRLDDALEELDDLLNEVKELGEDLDGYSEGSPSDASVFTVKTPFGKFEVDLEDYETKKKLAKDKINPPKYSLGRQMTRDFIGGEDQMDFRYWNNNLGSLKIGRAHVRTPVTEKSRMPSSA